MPRLPKPEFLNGVVRTINLFCFFPTNIFAKAVEKAQKKLGKTPRKKFSRKLKMFEVSGQLLFGSLRYC